MNTIADATKPGFMSPSDVAAINDLAAAVDVLSGANLRYIAHLGENTDPSQADLQAAYEAASGQTGAPPDGATLVDLDNNAIYTWFATANEGAGAWVHRGYDGVGGATNTRPGIVQGDETATPGKVGVEFDKTMSVFGWDNLTTLVNGMKSILDGMVGIEFQEFTESGTWTNNGHKLALVFVTGGGGGGSGGDFFDGGAGGQKPSGSNGARRLHLVVVSELSSVQVSIGTGGAGGAPGTQGATNDKKGKLGGSGGITSFGTLTNGSPVFGNVESIPGHNPPANAGLGGAGGTSYTGFTPPPSPGQPGHPGFVLVIAW